MVLLPQTSKNISRFFLCGSTEYKSYRFYIFPYTPNTNIPQIHRIASCIPCAIVHVCVGFYYYMARKETRWYHGIKQRLTAQYSGMFKSIAPRCSGNLNYFALGPRPARKKKVAVSRAARGNRFNHLFQEHSIFVF